MISEWSGNESALDQAVRALEKGGLVVLPTDTVYGIGADAFNHDAVARLLAAKGRGREMPPPVLVGHPGVLDALAATVPQAVRDLIAAFWPGALTIIVQAQPSLAWDLGETAGTVAVRMPDHPAALALLRRYGPLAVTSANLTGQPAAEDCATALEYFGTNVAAYVDAGPTPGPTASTIVDATGPVLRIVRQGVILAEQLREVAEL
ncbi:MAG: threonylcarbamoyl-AMP synthase [Ruaniaceae bacterium]|nr:threonylcarbamoyl-AMP synthase [Ruaniaceae bacterium]